MSEIHYHAFSNISEQEFLEQETKWLKTLPELDELRQFIGPITAAERMRLDSALENLGSSAVRRTYDEDFTNRLLEKMFQQGRLSQPPRSTATAWPQNKPPSASVDDYLALIELLSELQINAVLLGHPAPDVDYTELTEAAVKAASSAVLLADKE